MKRRHVILLLTLACHGACAHAGQPRDVRDGEIMEAAISTDAPTRVRLEGQRIVNVVGNIHSSSNCEGAPANGAVPQTAAQLATPTVNPRGDVILNCDLDKGEIYVRPVSASLAKPINLFVSSPRATYTLLLRPARMAADTLILRDRHIDSTQTASTNNRPAAAHHVRALKTLLVSMATGRDADGAQAEHMEVRKALWQEAEYTQLHRVEARALVGETYRLRNIGNTVMVLAEQEFDREGVLAVAIERHNLRPGEATLVHVIAGQEEGAR
ncbi:TraK domain-containing protein [Pseudoduganella lutea]|uniref:Conjugal transfer pilus assembly protein TraK n=1 Tax=Pseudoduganella lutea TaxID=321985 RepID=A0A4P6L4N3_9BURK|nr:type-F conjugative transfer system secretin TraK [Pseudoduganella lutea]QBE66285.1 conjugal transfer pilus assembly protein TraK [Pseudoduganella lutea]